MANTYRTSAVGPDEEEKANTNSLRVGWNKKILLTGITLRNVVRTKKYDWQELRWETQSEPRIVTDRNYVEGRSQNHSNTNQFLVEIGCNVWS